MRFMGTILVKDDGGQTNKLDGAFTSQTLMMVGKECDQTRNVLNLRAVLINILASLMRNFETDIP